MTKKILHLRYGIDESDINGTLKQFSEKVFNWIEEYGENAMINFYDGCAWGDGFDFEIIYEREETDKEYNRRLKQEEKNKEAIKKQKIAAEKRERTIYEKLKKKYEKT